MRLDLSKVIWVLVGLVAIVVAIGVITALAYGPGYAGSSSGYPYGMMYGLYGAGILMPVVMVIAFIFVILFLYFLISSITGNDHPQVMENIPFAETIARERYAKGEINEEEYLKILEGLRKSSSP